MKKVLMIASEASHFENFHIPYIEYLLKRNVEVFTASRGVFSLEGVTHFTIPYKKKLVSPGNVGVILKLASFIRKNGFDTVYTNSTLAGFTGRMAAILSGKSSGKNSGKHSKKLVHICHGYLFDDDGSFRSKVYLFFEKLVKKHTDLLAVMNSDDLQIAKKYGLGKKIVFLNGMGLDTEKFPPVSSEEIYSFKKAKGIAFDKYVFLCVGEFSERKHQKTIIEACSLLKSDRYQVVFAGDGVLLEECKDLVRENRLDDQLLFLGHCRQTNMLYRTCDCLISSSRYEGIPFNVLEGLYCGERVIVTDVKGNNDLAREHGQEMYGFSDPKALAELMSRHIEAFSAENRNSHRENLLKSKYTINNVLKENLSLLEMERDIAEK
ncbi:MAG: glycosyltransferase family 4 protein [Ruminococcaceae bacterium]|nr:glycosyltransferase family 4 protein [Oscillospiraceae bacterium]